MNSRLKKILLFARDPGGANTIVALYDLLRADKPIPGIIDTELQFAPDAELHLAGKDFAHEVFHSVGVDSFGWEQLTEKEETESEAVTESLVDWLSENHYDGIFTATSDLDDRSELRLWQAASVLGLMSGAFLDRSLGKETHRTNIIERFTDEHQSIVLPNLIFFTDEESCENALALGLDPSRLRVSGNIHLRSITKGQSAPEQDLIVNDVKNFFGVKADQMLMVFASENIQEMSSWSKRLPYSELSELRKLLENLASGRIPRKGPVDANSVFLIVRPHPRDREGKYKEYVESSWPFSIKVSREFTSMEIIRAADCVIGMDSMMLYEAEAMGKEVIRLVELD